MASSTLEAKAIQRAVRGAKWLDKKFPNWWKRVKVTALDQRWPDLCVLGQVDEAPYRRDNGSWTGDGSYYTIATELGIDGGGRRAVSLGFYAVLQEENSYWEHLTEAWKEEVRDRRAEDKYARSVA